MKIESKGFGKFIDGQIGKYKWEVGVFEDKPHYKANADGEVASGDIGGQPILKKSRVKDKKTLVDIAEDLDKNYKWLRRPWIVKQNKDIIEVINLIIDELNGKEVKQRILNSVQAVVRNPILRGDYGRNAPKTAKEKGFNKLLISTGQFFKSIKARW